MKVRKRRIKIQVVCGVGMGSSLMAKMTIDSIAEEMGIPISSDCATPMSTSPCDIIVTTPFLVQSLGDVGDAVVVVLTNFINKDHIKEKIGPELTRLFKEE